MRRVIDGGSKMEQLNYEVLKKSGYTGYVLEQAPVRMLQFGEGNFMRAFVDYFFDIANEKAGWNGKAVLVQPVGRHLPANYEEQQGLYTLYLRGSEKGLKTDKKRVISVVDSCLNPKRDWSLLEEIMISDDLEYITSNTTEAGIVYDPESSFDQIPPASFPAKLTKLLYERYRAGKKGVIILSCELIDNNGRILQECVNRHIADWKLGGDFETWINEACSFCSTLVDRIVPGAIRDPEEIAGLEAANGYADELGVVGEVFGVWYIEGPAGLAEKLPFEKAGVNVHVVPDVAPYKKRKVRILNGAHTGFVPGAYLSGENIVRDCMNNDTIRNFMNKMLYEEVIPVLPLDKTDCEVFAAAVTDRFNNPFVDHQLLSISLNSTAKWRARNLPTLLEYVEAFGELPTCLVMSLAACMAFYSTEIKERTEDSLICVRPAGDSYKVQDDAYVLDFYAAHKDASDKTLVHDVLKNIEMWGMDLNSVKGLEEAVLKDLTRIRTQGAEAAFASCLE